MRNSNRLFHAGIALAPLLLTPLLLFALAEGWIDLGGGEKDVIAVIPYFIWALAFFVCAVVLIIKKWTLGMWLTRAFAVSAVLLILLAIVAYVTSWLGIQ